MNQVSTFLENIISVEEARGADVPPGPEPGPEPTLEPRSEPAQAEPAPPKTPPPTETPTPTPTPTPTQPQTQTQTQPQPQTQPPPATEQVSAFWYLEDDPRKVANQLTDRLLEKVLGVMLSAEPRAGAGPDQRAVVARSRPPLSVHLMSSNTTQLVLRLSPVCDALAGAAYCAAWHDPWHTLGAALAASVLVLRPYVATAVPAAVVLARCFVPSYLHMYPPDPVPGAGRLLRRNPVPHAGAALARAEPPRPVSQFSREFVMNFTDLQNLMVVYVRAHDAAAGWGRHYVLFADPRLSAVVFVGLAASMAFNVAVLPRLLPRVLAAVPLRALLLVAVWLATALLHPRVRRHVLDAVGSEDARVWRRDAMDRAETALVAAVAAPAAVPPPQARLAEVYELHVWGAARVWEPVGFTGDFYALNDPRRRRGAAGAPFGASAGALDGAGALAGALAGAGVDGSGADFEAGSGAGSGAGGSDIDPGTAADDCAHIFRKATLAEIKPPEHWRFAEAAWQIDLRPRRWVAANCIADLVSVDADEKWVYDATPPPHGGPLFRRRRWVRQCVREPAPRGELRDSPAASSSERLSKTLSTLLL